MKTAALLFVFLVGSAALASEINKEAIATTEITTYLQDWTKNLPQRYWRRASKHIASVAHWSTHYNVDPLLVSVMISLESSWKADAIGDIGEIGLMQVHNAKAKKGFDLSDPDQQIQAGVKHLKSCIDICGNVKQGVNFYATGKGCDAEWGNLRFRMREYKEAVKLVRGK